MQESQSYHDTRSCRCNEEGIDAIKVGGRESRKRTIFSEIKSLMLYDIDNMQGRGVGVKKVVKQTHPPRTDHV